MNPSKGLIGLALIATAFTATAARHQWTLAHDNTMSYHASMGTIESQERGLDHAELTVQCMKESYSSNLTFSIQTPVSLNEDSIITLETDGKNGALMQTYSGAFLDDTITKIVDFENYLPTLQQGNTLILKADSGNKEMTYTFSLKGAHRAIGAVVEHCNA
ncbi:hypothetical protein [Vibrio superstes]|uniref:Uncharacterized protein n=1 Tax=Vibrio superstes NBRC 103154 TaxID=1219062 RepID=A0A511QNK8_9VIBR|nr:hypothetical protein [Vibrio superstes]GEM78516.1 hypothetical protein VSU01S_07610 [Vibrio superstes NBRC 103154]